MFRLRSTKNLWLNYVGCAEEAERNVDLEYSVWLRCDVVWTNSNLGKIPSYTFRHIPAALPTPRRLCDAHTNFHQHGTANR